MSWKKENKLETFAFLITWLVLACLAIFYRQERLFADSAYYFFHPVNQGYPQIEHQRFILILPELLPLLGSYLRLPLNALVLLYSLGHVLFGYLIFHNVYFRHKSKGHGLLILLLQFTGYVHLFFSPMLEIWYGIMLLVWLDHRLAIRKVDGWKNSLLLFVLCLTILFSHPENFIGLMLVIGFRLNEGKISRKIAISGLAMMGAVAVFKFLTFSSYEAGKVTNAQVNSELGMAALLKPEYLEKLGSMLLVNYLDCLLYLFLAAGIFIHYKMRFKGLLLLLFGVGFIVFINVTLHKNEFARYTESCYLPFTFICVFGIAMALEMLNSKWKIALGILITLFSINRISDILNLGNSMKQRTAQMTEFVEIARKKHHSKMVVKVDNITTDFTDIGWSYAIESLVLSSLEGPQYSASVIFDEDLNYKENRSQLHSKNFVLRRHDILAYEDLNERYFTLPEAEYSQSDIKRSTPSN
ncbi:hypothetical protein ACFLR1_01890 [Bacteroidota bacterium]